MKLKPSAFFAYPSSPRLSETIADFVRDANSGGLITIRTWEELQIGGKLLVSTICKAITEADLFCADITYLNPNVLFEIGFAIAQKKRIWLIRDSSILSGGSDYRSFKILTSLGYRDYVNSKNILDSFYQDKPFESLEETVYDEVIEPLLYDIERTHLLYIKSSYDDQASVRVTQHLQECSRKNRIRLLVDDPKETPYHPLTWYARNCFSADAVICHLTATDRNDSRIQNAKHSLAAGLASGFGAKVLLLIENETSGPADYQDLMFSYKRPTEALNKAEAFIAPLLDRAIETRRITDFELGRKNRLNQLSSLRLGDPIAENEDDTITENAFLETSAYRDAISGSQSVFVGRKGVGKTANFRRVSFDLSNQRKTLVCEIAPLSYELECVVNVAKKFESIGKRGFLFESLWKFLLYTEIAKNVIESIESRQFNVQYEEEAEILKFISENESMMNQDFSGRLETLARSLLSPSVLNDNSGESNLAISEILHNGALPRLCKAIQLAIPKIDRIAILVDNLDKAWDKSDDVDFLAYFFLGLLSAIRRVGQDFHNRHNVLLSKNVTLCVFVRADIFERVLSHAPEPDKILYQRIFWDDDHVLLQLAEARLVLASGESVPAELIKKKFFSTKVGGQDLFDYIFGIILKRPRDLLFFLRSAIETAVNRRHDQVEEDDAKKAEEFYSDFALKSAEVELREEIPDLDLFFQELMGLSPVIDIEDLTQILRSAGISTQAGRDSALKSLCLAGVFEIESIGESFVGVSSERDFNRHIRASERINGREKRSSRFRVHRAFWKELLIDPSK